MAMLRVDEITARRLADFKGKKTYNVILNEMMDFFVNTGMRVTDNVAAPIITTQQEAAKLQKQIRAFESKQNTLLKDILERTNMLVQKMHSEAGTIQQTKLDDNFMDVEEVQELMANYKNLQTKLSKKEGELKEMRLEIDNLRKLESSMQKTNQVNKVVISECLDKLWERKQSTMFDNEKYSIRKSDFNMCIDTIREELNK